MKNTLLQSTLREWRAHATHRTALLIFGCVAVVLTIVGPFGSDELLRVVPRFAYWLVIIVSTYSAGFWVNSLLQGTVGKRVSRIVLVCLNGAATGIAVALIVAVLNGLTLGYWPTVSEWPIFFGNIFVIAFVVAIIFDVATEQNAQPDSTPPPLLDRLPFEMRAPLVAISVEDHYVRIQTTKGSEMVLMRLSDAIKEVGETAGLQVHRSHWIALDAVQAAARKGDGATLTMSHGPAVPVSRSNVAAIKDAGLLPKPAHG